MIGIVLNVHAVLTEGGIRERKDVLPGQACQPEADTIVFKDTVSEISTKITVVEGIVLERDLILGENAPFDTC